MANEFGKLSKEELEHTIREALDAKGIPYEVATVNGKRVLLPPDHGPDAAHAIVNIDRMWSNYHVGDLTPGQAAETACKCLTEPPLPIDGLPLPRTAREVRNKLVATLCPLEEARVGGIVHRPFLDLAIVPRIVVKKDEGCIMSSEIQEGACGLYGMSADELIDAALENGPKLWPPVVMTIGDALASMLGVEEDINADGLPMFISTVSSRSYGASAILYPGVLNQIRARMGGRDFYVLPSSRHECISMPADIGEAEELRQIVYEINDVFVAPEDVLCETVYFCGKDGLSIAG